MKRKKYSIEKEHGIVVIKCKDTKIVGFKNFSEARDFLKILGYKKRKRHKLDILFNLDK